MSAAMIEVVGGPPLPPLKILSKAIELEGLWGLCIHRSAAFVFDVPAAVLCFGTFKEHPNPTRPEHSPVSFIHAWAEYRGLAYAPTTIEMTDGRLHAMNREGYYAVNEARDIHRLARAELMKLDKRFGLKRALRANVACRDGASFGAVLLDASGVPWTESPQGGVVPRGASA